ncbi:MAG TPA: DUF2783 domain-containing protein [Geminicoccaceae bacterium]
MASLSRDDWIDQPDELYQLLVDAHQGLSPAQSRQLDASIVLLLANHIGDAGVVAEAVRAARAAATREEGARAGEGEP